MHRPQHTVRVPDVVRMVRSDPERREILDVVETIPGAWVGAGFVRNRVWDVLTGRTSAPGDVDVLVFAPEDADFEARAADALRSALPSVDWDVRDQSRMHVHNGHRPYRSVADAIARFPETATAVAIRGEALLCPYGLGDLAALRVRPTPWGGPFAERAARRRWMDRWPEVTVDPSLPATCAGWLDYGGWTPIRACPGRWTWTAGHDPEIGYFGRFEAWDVPARDRVMACALPDGGFVAYVGAERTVLTLGDADGYARKRAELHSRGPSHPA